MAKCGHVKIYKREREHCDEKTKPFVEAVKRIAEFVEGEDITWGHMYITINFP